MGKVEANLEAADVAPECVECGYTLVGLPEDRCPECGRPFDPADPSTYHVAVRVVRRDLTWLEVVVLLTMSAGFACAGLDAAEGAFQLVAMGGALFFVARAFALDGDRFWLAPLLFFVGFAGCCCWAHAWRDSAAAGLPFLSHPIVVPGGIIGLVGALALAGERAVREGLMR